MKEHICEVVPIYVRPQPITEERACVGVIVRCPESGYSSYRLIEEGEPSFSRVAAFFPRLGRENLLRALAWSKSDIAYSFESEDKTIVEKRFTNLIRPRESIIQYGAPQIQVCAEPEIEMDKIYRTMVA